MIQKSLHNLARDVLAEFPTDMATSIDETSIVERMVGNLRVSGFSDPISSVEDHSTACGILRTLVPRYTKRIDTSLVKTAASRSESTTVIAADSGTTDKFLEIEALMKKGLCPRCKTSMSPVKLCKYQVANFCPGCRTTVWKN